MLDSNIRLRALISIGGSLYCGRVVDDGVEDSTWLDIVLRNIIGSKKFEIEYSHGLLVSFRIRAKRRWLDYEYVELGGRRLICVAYQVFYDKPRSPTARSLEYVSFVLMLSVGKDFESLWIKIRVLGLRQLVCLEIWGR